MFEFTNSKKILSPETNFNSDKTLNSIKLILDIHYQPLHYFLKITENYEIYIKEPVMVIYNSPQNSFAFFGNIDQKGEFKTCYDTQSMDNLYEHFCHYNPKIVSKIELYVREILTDNQNNYYRLVKNVYRSNIY